MVWDCSIGRFLFRKNKYHPKVKSEKVSFRNWFILFFLGSIWGSSFILLKIGSRSFDTIDLAAGRMFFASIILLPFLLSIVRKYDRKIVFWMFFSALVGSTIPAFLYSFSASRMDSNVNGVINSLTPIFTLVVGMIWLRNPTSKLSILGVVIGFIGVIILITQRNVSTEQNKFALFPLAATILYGINMNVVKVKLGHLPSIDILKGVFGFIALIFAPIVIYNGVLNNIDFSLWSPQFWIHSDITEVQKMNSLTAIVFLGLIGTLFASWLFYLLMKSTNALFASMNTYLMPLMAIFWGWLDGEPIGWPHFISLFVILIGVYLVSKRK